MGRRRGAGGRRWRRGWVLLAVCVGTVCAAAPQKTAEHGEIDSAYFQGRLVRFQLAPLEEGEKPFVLGPWRFGALVATKPHDKRLNLYLVSPGQQHRTPGWKEYDHNDVINALPPGGAEREWDVYWAIVLDPALRRELRAERDLLLEAQNGFRPNDLYSLQDAPGRAFLTRFVGARSVRDLRRFRRRDGRLPRLIIVPAGFAIRGSAFEPPAEEPEAEAR